MSKNMRQEVQPVLTEEERHQVARWLGEFQPPQTIKGLVHATFGKAIADDYANTFLHRKKWSLLIDRYRQEWLVKVAEVPLFHKKYRLERLQQLIERLDRQMDAESVLPAKYEMRLLRILEKARLEMEEKPDTHQFYFTNINSYTDEELVQRREQLLKRIQAFRLPIRRLTHGHGESGRAGAPAPREDSQDDGGNGEVGDGEVDLSSERGVGGLDASPDALGAARPSDSRNGVTDA